MRPGASHGPAHPCGDIMRSLEGAGGIPAVAVFGRCADAKRADSEGPKVGMSGKTSEGESSSTTTGLFHRISDGSYL